MRKRGNRPDDEFGICRCPKGWDITDKKKIEARKRCLDYRRQDISAFLPDLTSPDRYKRAVAAEALGCIRDPRAVEPLITTLMDDESNDEKIRANAAEALGKIRDVRAIDALILATAFPDHEIRKQAVKALGRFRDPRLVKSLVARLKDDRPEVGLAAAQALGRIRDASAIRPLVLALKDYGLYDRGTLKWAMATTDMEQAVSELVLALGHEDESVRAAAAWGLGHICEPTPYPGDKKGDDPDDEELIYEGEIMAYIQWLNTHIEEMIANGTRKVKVPRVINALISALDDPCEAVANDAAESLGELGDPTAVEPLLKKLGDARLRLRVATALCKLGDVRALRPVIDAYTRCDRYTQILLGTELGRFKGDYAIDCFVEALKSDSIGLRVIAANQMCSIGDSRAVEPLIAALDDDSESLRLSAIIALGHIGDPRAAKPVVACVRDRRKNIRALAIDALADLGGEDCIGVLAECLEDEDEEIRSWAQCSIDCITSRGRK